MLEIDLLRDLKQGRTWEQVTVLLGGFTRPQWRGIAVGEKHATLLQRNLIRAACDLVPLEDNIAKRLAALGVDDIVQIDNRPNTAVLFAVKGVVLEATIKTGVLPGGDPGGIPVTLGYRAVGPRKPRRGRTLLTTDILARQPPKTRYGFTMNFQAASMILSEAATIYEEATE